MKLVSWNVNGLRACLNKGFLDFVALADADVICLQETKLQPHQVSFELPGYRMYFNSADKAGYSGTAVLTRKEPLNVTYDFGDDEHRHEGRVITAEYEDFYLVCCYTPNSQDELRRLPYRMRWEDDLREYLCGLDQTKPVVYCGDLNVAHEEIDLKNPKTNHFNPGFSDEERGKMTELLALAGPRRRLFVVELPRGVADAERGVEDRLFYRVRTAARAHQKGGDLERDHGQRPLPRDAGAGMNGKGGRLWAFAFCAAEFRSRANICLKKCLYYAAECGTIIYFKNDAERVSA